MIPGTSEPRRACEPQPEPQTHGPAVMQLGPESMTVFRPESHRHDYSTVLVLAAGEGQHRVDGVEQELRPPQVILLGERQTHGWRVPAPPQGLAVRFTPSELDAVVRLPNSVRAGTTLGLEPVRPTARSWSRLATLLSLIGAAGVGDAGAAESAARRSGSLLLGALLLEAYGDGGARVLTAPQRDADPDHALVRRFRLAVRAEPNATHGVAWHARALGVSPRTLTELVRDASDATPGKLVRAGIAAEAARLLRASDDPIHRVATRLGFSDAAYFSRFVRRELGVAPGQLRAAR